MTDTVTIHTVVHVDRESGRNIIRQYQQEEVATEAFGKELENLKEDLWTVAQLPDAGERYREIDKVMARAGLLTKAKTTVELEDDTLVTQNN